MPRSSWQKDFCLLNTLSHCPMARADICLFRPLIGLSVFRRRLGFLAASDITDALVSWELVFSAVARARRQEWGGGCAEGGRDSTADIHGDLKVCERQLMEHLFAWGHWNFLPAQACAECKASFQLFCRNSFLVKTDKCAPSFVKNGGSFLELYFSILAVLILVIYMGKISAGNN